MKFLEKLLNIFHGKEKTLVDKAFSVCMQRIAVDYREVAPKRVHAAWLAKMQEMSQAELEELVAQEARQKQFVKEESIEPLMVVVQTFLEEPTTGSAFGEAYTDALCAVTLLAAFDDTRADSVLQRAEGSAVIGEAATTAISLAKASKLIDSA